MFHFGLQRQSLLNCCGLQKCKKEEKWLSYRSRNWNNLKKSTIFQIANKFFLISLFSTIIKSCSAGSWVSSCMKLSASQLEKSCGNLSSLEPSESCLRDVTSEDCTRESTLWNVSSLKYLVKSFSMRFRDCPSLLDMWILACIL